MYDKIWTVDDGK